MATLLRLYSYFYHAILCLGMLAVGLIAWLSTGHTLRLQMLPWEGVELRNWLFILGIFGMVSILLAISGFFRYLFPFWALFVAFMMVRGFLLQPYTFDGSEEFYWVLALIAGAILAFLGSLTLFRSRPRR